MLAAVRSDQNGVTTTSLVIATAVNADNNVTLKNLQVDNLIPGTGWLRTRGRDRTSSTFADLGLKGHMDLRINPGTLPPRTRLQMFLPEFKTTAAA